MGRAMWGIALALALAPFPAGAQPLREPADRHALGMTLWVIMSKPVDTAKEQATLARHLAHQDELERDGIMFGAGPLVDPDGGNRVGLIIIRAKDEADARRIADSDPMHMIGARTYTLKRWTMNEGALDVTLHYSKGSGTIR